MESSLPLSLPQDPYVNDNKMREPLPQIIEECFVKLLDNMKKGVKRVRRKECKGKERQGEPSNQTDNNIHIF